MRVKVSLKNVFFYSASIKSFLMIIIFHYIIISLEIEYDYYVREFISFLVIFFFFINVLGYTRNFLFNFGLANYMFKRFE